ncbi:MAG: DUF3373 family protein [Campylobacterota bacterium]
MKKAVVLSAVAALGINAAAATTEQLQQQIEELKTQIEQMQESRQDDQKDFKRLKSSFNEVKAHDAGDNIKFGVDLRTSYDYVNYDVDGQDDTDNSILSNRLLLTMAQQPTDNLIFKGALAMNKVFGHNNVIASNSMQNYDWFSTTTPSDDTLRVREAYFVYFGELGEVDYTASFGRRPSLNGLAGNLREDDPAASPLAHNINMQFDGASFNFKMEELTDIPGFAMKLCLGRGYSNANAKYVYTPIDFQETEDVTPNDPQDSYAENEDTTDMDMVGIISKLYDDGKYSATLNLFYAQNMLGIKDAMNFHSGFQDVGDMTGGALTFMADGIGDSFFGFWANTKIFASAAFSRTDPKDGVITENGGIDPNTGNPVDAEAGMLGSTDSETGHSFYAGIQMPDLLTDDGRLGFEYNYGSEHWRSFTYGEDTMIGSKLAARGNAYEAYWTKPLVGENVDMQLRYTYIDYDYSGSQMFFGASGAPSDDPTIDAASNLRAYIRYRY